jgi:adenine-specific DNA-methyltransferase
LPDTWRLFRNRLLPDEEEGYSNPDNDRRGPWKSIPFSAQGYRKNQVYDIITPTGKVKRPPKGRCWAATEPEFEELKRQCKVYWPNDGDGLPRIKQFPADAKGLVPDTLWMADEVGDTEESKKELLAIFSDRETLDFHAPKPPALIQRVIEIATKPDSIILDSFAGTGATAQAVLALNKRDNGTRRFILVECEDYADTLTAERVRRVINGYAFSGTQREELFRQRLTFTRLKRVDRLLERISEIEKKETERFDRIETTLKDGELLVTGLKDITDKTDGLGGQFTFCSLGDPIEMDRLLTGKTLPTAESLGTLLYHMATNEVRSAGREDENVAGCRYLGESTAFHVWLIYRPELDFLKSGDAALTLARAEALAAARPTGKRHLVFAAAKFVSQKLLDDKRLPVEFAPLPFALYRAERS